ncbi:ferredoxin [Acetobacterium woodii]|uniref:ferredoxin n=1 Tax=Acetobacterium woodii TaxID=33952 RepID=UPI0005A2ACBE|nr:ferredoxin [Acetobacterium woodii]
MKATVDRDTCIGCGLCESVCPEVFEMGSDDIAKVITEVIVPANEACALEAQDECPVSAIHVD